MEPISSTQNDKVKLAHILQTRARARRKERKIVLEGLRLVRDALETGHRPLFLFYDVESIDPTQMDFLASQRKTLIPAMPQVINHMADTQQPQGLIGVFPLPMPNLPESPRQILILDALRDPGNMGTILRTAAAAGVDTVILTPECADPYNPKTLRSGMGAHFRTPITEADWPTIQSYCEDIAVYVATGQGTTAYDSADWQTPWALIIGSEAHGVSPEAAKIATDQLFIPLQTQTESLNAAVAAGVILFEAARQRRHMSK